MEERKTSDVKILEEKCVTVQRLSAEALGKAQKYTRVGAREFFPFEYDEWTVENIKRACLSHVDVWMWASAQHNSTQMYCMGQTYADLLATMSCTRTQPGLKTIICKIHVCCCVNRH